MTGDPGDKKNGRASTTAVADKKTVDGESRDQRMVSSEDERVSDELEDVVRLVARSPSRSPGSEPLPGMRWGASGRYVIQKRVGAGGMGTVYEATDELLGRVVALKVLHRSSDEDEEVNRARILREARLAARVEHERIARVYDVGEHEGVLFVAMEFVRGTSLRTAIGEGGSEMFYALNLATQIAEGLAELHANDVIHRDLKPENVILSKQGGVKLVDFGLAREHARDVHH